MIWARARKLCNPRLRKNHMGRKVALSACSRRSGPGQSARSGWPARARGNHALHPGPPPPHPRCFGMRKGPAMSDAKLPLIHKAPVEGLAIHVARTGLSIGDQAWLDRLSDGRIGVFARLKEADPRPDPASPRRAGRPSWPRGRRNHLSLDWRTATTSGCGSSTSRPSIWPTATRPRSTSRSGATRVTCSPCWHLSTCRCPSSPRPKAPRGLSGLRPA